MVKLEKNKAIIEISSVDPIGDIQELQDEIINVLKYYDYENFGNTNGCPFGRLLDLLRALLPSDNVYRNLLNRSN